MSNLYDEIKKAEKRAHGLDPWDQKCPHKNQRLLRLKKRLQKEGIWESDDDPKNPHTVAALMRELKSVRGAWQSYRSLRRRDSVYQYLEAVGSLVTKWLKEGTARWNAERCVRLHKLTMMKDPDPFATVISCTSDPSEVDSKTRSKWTRALRFGSRKPSSQTLAAFMRKCGGINNCAAGAGRRSKDRGHHRAGTKSRRAR
jgi:hypothetical protein